MKPKDGNTARCANFIARGDFQRLHWIQCGTWRMVYLNEAERDADYRAACCCDPNQCPVHRLPKPGHLILHLARGNGKHPALWPLTEHYPTIESIKQEIQEMQSHE